MLLSQDVTQAYRNETGKGNITSLHSISLIPSNSTNFSLQSERASAQSYVQQAVAYANSSSTPVNGSAYYNLTNFAMAKLEDKHVPSELSSQRFVTSNASCTRLPFIVVSNHTSLENPLLQLTFNDSRNTPQALNVTLIPNNSTTFFSQYKNPDSRTTQTFALWAGPAMTGTTLFDCNNTVPQVEVADFNGTHQRELRQDLQMPDTQACVWAGAVGWSSVLPNESTSDAVNQQSQFINEAYGRLSTGFGLMD